LDASPWRKRRNEEDVDFEALWGSQLAALTRTKWLNNALLEETEEKLRECW
jgi:hypothetical protein